MWVSARKTFRRRLAFVFVLSVCVLNVIPRSYVTPRIFGVFLMGRGVLLSVMCGWVLYSLLYGVIKVMDDLFAETFNLFVFSQFSNVFMYVCRLLAAVSCRGCCEMMLTSSAYESVVTEEFVGVGRSCRYKLKSVGESTEPCGTPSV